MPTATVLNLLTYGDILARQRSSLLRSAEVPVESVVSLPAPTLRTGRPGYAFFASPTSSLLMQPVRQGPPDQWWVYNAGNGQLEVFALTRVVPFAGSARLERATMPPETRTVPQVRAAAEDIERRMTELAPIFFAGDPGDTAARQDLLRAISDHVSSPVMPYYLALAPDFFAWLGEK